MHLWGSFNYLEMVIMRMNQKLYNCNVKQKMVEDICPHLCIRCVSQLRYFYQILRIPHYEHNESFSECFTDTKVQLWTFCWKEDWCHVFVSIKIYQIKLDKTKESKSLHICNFWQNVRYKCAIVKKCPLSYNFTLKFI